MKYIFLIFLIFLLTSCSKPKAVLICGDHVCLNKAEAELYFEENLTLEVKIIDKKVNKNIDLIELNLKNDVKGSREVLISSKNKTNKNLKVLSNEEIVKIKKNIKDNLSILDVGCGSGNFYSYINSISKTINYTGIDFDYEKMSKKKFYGKKNFNIISKDLRENWDVGEYDFVWSSEVIEHLFDDKKFFKQLVKSTKKNGYIIITTPYLDSYLSFAKKYGWSIEPSKEEIVGHVKLGYTEKDLINFGVENNLKLVDIYFISECNNFRSKYFFKLNNGLFCYIFNFLYYIGLFRFKRFSSTKKQINKLNYFSIAAIYKK